MLAVRAVSMGLAGTDFAQHRHFTTAAEEYRRDIQRVMNDDIAANQKQGRSTSPDETLWAKVPEFEYVAPSAVVGAGATCAGALSVLGVWLAAWSSRMICSTSARAETALPTD